MYQVCHTKMEKPSISLIKSICYPSTSSFSTEATEWGISNEKIAINRMFDAVKQYHSNAKIHSSGLVISTKYPFIAASPDAVLTCDCCPNYCVEVKCPFNACHGRLENCKFLIISDSGGMMLDRNHEYYYQVQTQLGVSEFRKAFFAVYLLNAMHIEIIDFDEKFWSSLCLKAEQFFFVAILPELISKYFTRDLLHNIK